MPSTSPKVCPPLLEAMNSSVCPSAVAKPKTCTMQGFLGFPARILTYCKLWPTSSKAKRNPQTLQKRYIALLYCISLGAHCSFNAGDAPDLLQKKKGTMAASLVAMWQINAVFNGLLLAGAADGGVRVWRDYTFPGTQKLATAWQVGQLLYVPAPSPSGVSSSC